MKPATKESMIRKKEHLKRIVKDQGIRPGLTYLNSLTVHRFSALYRFNGETLKNLFFFDRHNPSQESLPDIPVLASYCVFVRSSGTQFCVEDATKDERVASHPKRIEVQSYCGVPLLDRFGKMFGTMCHFDIAPNQAVTAEDIELMEQMGSLLEDEIEGLASTITKSA